MRPIATSVARSVVHVSVGVLGTGTNCVKTAEPIVTQFGGQIRVRPDNRELDGVSPTGMRTLLREQVPDTEMELGHIL